MEKTIIDVNGVKLEVDLRSATRIEEYKVGDNIKLLKKSYCDNYESHYGVIVGFDAFKELPTIIIAYLENSYSEPGVKFEYFNQKTKGLEICHLNEHEDTLDRVKVLDILDNQVAKKETELNELKQKREYFLKYYKKCFKD